MAKKKMTSKRAAELYTTTIACRLNESWLATNPYLLFTYINQYLPILQGLLTKIVGPKRTKEILHSQNQKKSEY